MREAASGQLPMPNGATTQQDDDDKQPLTPATAAGTPTTVKRPAPAADLPTTGKKAFARSDLRTERPSIHIELEWPNYVGISPQNGRTM